jgi:4-hydroxybenzoate polyprenyltransferase
MARVRLGKRPATEAASAGPEPVERPPDPAHDDPDPAYDAPDAPDAPPTWRRRIADSAPVTLFWAAHPRQGVLTAVALAGVALVSGRPGREAAVVLVTVLVGQAILGWHNDLVDRERDAAHDVARKPVAQGRLDPGTAWYALVVAVLLVIPLSLSVGVTAGVYYLASLVVGVLGNVVLRRGLLSPLPWMVSFGLYPAYLSHGGYGGDAVGSPPEPAMVGVWALLGLGLHVLRAIWGLVQDDQEGWTYLPLRLGRRLGATRLLVVAGAYTGAVVAVLVVLGSTIGLRR